MTIMLVDIWTKDYDICELPILSINEQVMDYCTSMQLAYFILGHMTRTFEQLHDYIKIHGYYWDRFEKYYFVQHLWCWTNFRFNMSNFKPWLQEINWFVVQWKQAHL